MVVNPVVMIFVGLKVKGEPLRVMVRSGALPTLPAIRYALRMELPAGIVTLKLPEPDGTVAPLE